MHDYKTKNIMFPIFHNIYEQISIKFLLAQQQTNVKNGDTDGKNAITQKRVFDKRNCVLPTRVRLKKVAT
jgi:hypothetical protein